MNAPHSRRFARFEGARHEAGDPNTLGGYALAAYTVLDVPRRIELAASMMST